MLQTLSAIQHRAVQRLKCDRERIAGDGGIEHQLQQSQPGGHVGDVVLV